MKPAHYTSSRDPQSQMVHGTFRAAKWQDGVFTTSGGSQYEKNEIGQDRQAIKTIANTLRGRERSNFLKGF